jgi:hypothetical protein
MTVTLFFLIEDIINNNIYANFRTFPFPFWCQNMTNCFIGLINNISCGYTFCVLILFMGCIIDVFLRLKLKSFKVSKLFRFDLEIEIFSRIKYFDCLLGDLLKVLISKFRIKIPLQKPT